MTSTPLRLIGGAQFRAFRCIWMLEELQVPYEILPALPASREAREYNPSGKIPALVVTEPAPSLFDDSSNTPLLPTPTIVTESAVINTFLGDRYPESGLVPKHGTLQRLRYDQMVMTIMTELDASALWIHRKHIALGKHFGYVPEIEKPAADQFERMNAIIMQHLRDSGGPFLLGRDFTAADILYVHCCDWVKSIGWDKTLGSKDLTTYMKLCHDRPAYQKASELKKVDSSDMIQRVPNKETSQNSNL